MDAVLSRVARGLRWGLHRMPLRWGLRVAQCAGWVGMYLRPATARVAYLNLKAAFGPDLDHATLRRLTRQSFQSLVMMVAELLQFPWLDAAYFRRLITVEGRDRIPQALAQGRGVILLTGHLGNWELAGLVSSLMGHPMMVLVRPQNFPRVNALLDQHRAAWGNRVIRKGLAVRTLVRALRENGIVGMLADQHARRGNVLVPLFGRLAFTPVGPAVLALKTGCQILPCFILREGVERHRVFIEPPLPVVRTGDDEADVRRIVEAFHAVLERFIRRAPGQWLWVHKRWKRTPSRRIVVLSDGRAGHLHQSRAVAQALERRLAEQGGTGAVSPHVVCDVTFRRPVLRRFFKVTAPLVAWWGWGGRLWVRACLTRTAAREVLQRPVDLVVSCGSALAGVNVIMARANRARSIVLMRPGYLSPRAFDLAIIPRHDRPRAQENVLVTEGAPNLVRPELLTQAGRELDARLTRTAPVRIALLLGGGTSHLALSAATIHTVLDELLRAAASLGAQLLVTTSMGTSREVVRIVQERLTADPRCGLLVIPGRGTWSAPAADGEAIPRTGNGTIFGILGLSDLIVVSAGSISMVSEAASSGRYTIAFPLDKRSHRLSRHEVALQHFAQGGYVTVSPPERLAETLTRLWQERPAIRVLPDNAAVATALARCSWCQV